MAFLFKSKKSQSNNALPPANRDIHTSEGPKSSIPTVNGFKDKDKAGGPVQTTPSSSVNNSLNSLGGAGTPSPDNGSGPRERTEQDSQVSWSDVFSPCPRGTVPHPHRFQVSGCNQNVIESHG